MLTDTVARFFFFSKRWPVKDYAWCNARNCPYGTFEALAIPLLWSLKVKKNANRKYKASAKRYLWSCCSITAKSHERSCVNLWRETCLNLVVLIVIYILNIKVYGLLKLLPRVESRGQAYDEFYNSFLDSPFPPVPAALPALTFTFCFSFSLLVCISTQAATSAVPTSLITVPQEIAHICILTLPMGALGKERIHSI